MHPNRAFRGETTKRHLTFVRDRVFGTLSVNGPEGPVMAHVPVLLSEDGRVAEAHLVRSNPMARMLDTPLPAVIAVTGPDGYVSPDWYESAGQVPTWNYVAVHLRGTLTRMPDDILRDLLVRQSAAYEARLAPKPAWLIDKVDEVALGKLLRAIVPVRLDVDRVDGTWKLSQNKTEADRNGATESIKQGFGSELPTLATLMRRRDGAK
ncbi:FMN-binding negative transcriptional regulator [uncultured Maritimibacter sp.]|jgi:transcriptional regulator|uniref:FMN-binding negative transcriptional regulator n=1 Tax=uncultured Maritimibacter sp. TaxID=991866 RepID=UPI000A539703|nr:FMN-binding negative transcriptional regulator [uncultured Maritimibacter sp.]